MTFSRENVSRENVSRETRKKQQEVFHVKHAADSGLKMFHVKRVETGREKCFT